MKMLKTMFKTELKLSLRGIDMFIFAICMPIVVIMFLGIIYGNQPAYEGSHYTFLQQSFGAVSTIAICAGGLMGLPLVVTDYRSRKILKRFQVTPIKPTLILLVQVMIYALYSFISLLLVYLTAYIFFDFHMIGSVFEFIFAYIIVMLSMFSIGMMVGGIAKDTKIAGVLASLLYFPMLIFSGTTLPYEIMPTILQRVSDVLPLTQGIKLLKAASLGLPYSQSIVSIFIMIVIIFVCMFVSIKCFKWE